MSPMISILKELYNITYILWMTQQVTIDIQDVGGLKKWELFRK